MINPFDWFILLTEFLLSQLPVLSFFMQSLYKLLLLQCSIRYLLLQLLRFNKFLANYWSFRTHFEIFLVWWTQSKRRHTINGLFNLLGLSNWNRLLLNKRRYLWIIFLVILKAFIKINVNLAAIPDLLCIFIDANYWYSWCSWSLDHQLPSQLFFSAVRRYFAGKFFLLDSVLIQKHEIFFFYPNIHKICCNFVD